MNALILHGRRSIELQKCRNFSVSMQNVFFDFSNSFSSASATDVIPQDVRKGKNFTVSYLIDSLGFTSKLAESISRKVSFEEKSNPESVLSLLRSHGFTDSQISSIITDYPLLLIADAEKSIAPKLKFFQSKGASSSELTDIVSKVPKIFGMRGERKTVSRYYDFVKEIVEADKSSKYEKLCHSMPHGSKQENKLRNILVLRELGVPQSLLFSLLISNHHVCCGKEKFEESLKKIVEMGFDPTTSKFVDALSIMQGLSNKTVEDKVNVYKRLGFSVGDVWSMFKKFPMFLGFSEKKILNSMETFTGLGFTRDEFVAMVKRNPMCVCYSTESVKNKTEFLVKKMNWPLKSVVLHPSGFGYSLQKRIIPRCNVIKALMSKGLIRSELPPMSSVLASTDQAFLNKYVMKHDDKKLVPELIAIFTRNRVSLTDHLEGWNNEQRS